MRCIGKADGPTRPTTAAMRLSYPRSFLSLLLIGFSLFMLWQAYSISKFESLTSAGAFPMFATAVMVISGLLIAGQTARAKVAPGAPGESLLRQFVRQITPGVLVSFTLATAVYMGVLDRLGFLLASYLFLAVSMWLLGSRRIARFARGAKRWRERCRTTGTATARKTARKAGTRKPSGISAHPAAHQASVEKGSQRSIQRLIGFHQQIIDTGSSQSLTQRLSMIAHQLEITSPKLRRIHGESNSGFGVFEGGLSIVGKISFRGVDEMHYQNIVPPSAQPSQGPAQQRRVFGRRRAVGIIEGEDDLRPVPRRPHRGAGEDDVAHILAAQRLRRGRAHDPAQRLEEVRLAAAVRADDAGQAVADLKIRPLDERLEADQAEIVEFQGQRSRTWRGASGALRTPAISSALPRRVPVALV